MSAAAPWAAHFGLKRTPFGKSIAAKDLFARQAHAEAVARINFCVVESALGVITGDVGAGKTVSVRAAVDTLDPTRHQVIYIANPAFGTRGLYVTIVRSLGAEPRYLKAELMAQAADLLAAESAERHRRVVLVCDEAHLLDPAQLEELRLLTLCRARDYAEHAPVKTGCAWSDWGRSSTTRHNPGGLTDAFALGATGSGGGGDLMKQPSWPDITGPLESYAAGYRRELTRLGYSRWAASAHMYLMAHVSSWLGERELTTGAFDSVRVGQFLADRRAEGYATRLTPRGLIPLLGYLRGLGVLSEEPVPEPEGPVGRLLAEFGEYLTHQRGLAPATIVDYQRVGRLFLVKCAPNPAAEGCGVQQLGVERINAFLLSECARRSVGSANNMVTALRALMRFFYLRGYTAASLVDCVPHGAAWRDSGRSRSLELGDVRRLLASCDRRTASGRRDFAILTVLARLGLRANEVASLCVDDLDWRAGEVAVTGKGARRDRLPVPVDVGQAVADYCRRGRPRNGDRALFLHVRAPYGRLSSDAISHVVVQACRRAGLAPVGAHRLRHSSASAMRRAGAPLFEIGQILRHRWVVTTALYAKDDLGALASIARPWPGGRA